MFFLSSDRSKITDTRDSVGGIKPHYWSLGDLDVILKIKISYLFYLYVSSDLLMIMPLDKCHKTLVFISHGSDNGLVPSRQQAIT